MKRKPAAPRNPFVVAAKFRKAGAHKKSNKALRRQEKVRQPKLVDEWSRSERLREGRAGLFNVHHISRIQTKAIALLLEFLKIRPTWLNSRAGIE